MPLVAHTETGFSFFYLLGVVSGTFQTLLTCYGLFQWVPLLRSHKVTDCFDWKIYYKSTSCRFYYKGVQALLWSEIASSSAGIIKWSRYYKAGQLLLQSGAIITKVVQYRRQPRQTGESNRFWQFTPILNPELLSETDILPLEILQKLEFCFNYKIKNIIPPPQAYLRDS